MTTNDPDKDSNSVKRILVPKPPQIITPGEGIAKPPSPHQRRLSKLRRVPPQKSLKGLALQRAMDSDLEFQFKWKDFSSLWPYRLLGKLNDGCGLHMSRTLRWYLGEYVNRYSKVGPNGFPSSFNTLEAFMKLFEGNMLFDLRTEIDHLVPISQYFIWYNSNNQFKAPLLLAEIMTEGVIYSFDMMGGKRGLVLNGDSEIKIAGISMVRHEYELSCVMLTGEVIDDEIKASRNKASMEFIRPGREALLKSSKECEFNLSDSLLEGYEGFTKVFVLARIDLRDGRFDSRTVQADMGSVFSVISDDPDIWDEGEGGWEACRNLGEKISEYSSVFSALASLIYLPVFFSIHHENIQELEVYTELGAKPRKPDLNKVLKKLGHSSCITKRTISCLPDQIDDFGETPEEITPPPIEMKSTGYWRNIAPNEMGEGKNGEKVFGRTWVTRLDNWVMTKPESFLVERSGKSIRGPDPGLIYIQRCPGHVLNLYKIGLTRRSVEGRSKELSSATGVPLPFGVLASWSVGNCAKIESLAHERLQKFRVNSRREFFLAELSLICKTIEISIIDGTGSD